MPTLNKSGLMDILLNFGKPRLIVIFLNLGKSKLTLQQNPIRRNWMPKQLSRLLIHGPSTRPLASQTYEGLRQFWALPRLFSVAYFSWLFRHLIYLLTLLFPTQLVRQPLVTYSWLCSTCVSYMTPCHASSHQVLLTQPLPREEEDFIRGDNYFKHVPRITYVIYFSPKEIYVVGSI